ncbi:MAG: hypothetical protein KC503_44640 [Myxococcales bacterium]|nr:hypothetical protein [Myxococcales bacterium]
MTRCLPMLLALALVGCGDTAGPIADVGARDILVELASRDRGAADGDSAGDGASDATAGESAPAPSNGIFDGCRAFADCPAGTVCNFSLGRCDRRLDWTASSAAFISYHPLAVAPGDVLVIDVARLWQSFLFPPASIDVRVGTQTLAAYGDVLDDTRVVVPIAAAVSGTIELKTDTGQLLRSTRPLAAATSSGARACDGDTPTARGSAGAAPDATGPHAAGYLDLAAHVGRLFYPARCGGARRPAITGTHPLVVLLHGNGAGYMAHEYLGQLLASWGFVALMPDAKVDYSAPDPVAIAAQQTQTLLAAIGAVRDRDLGALAPQLAGVVTSPQVAFVGHSRGTARIQHVVGADAALRNATVATIFLGPVDDGDVVPGLFMLFSGDADAQSPPLVWGAAWARQGKPKWRIELHGGNHSLFTDHKVWTGFLDGQPTLARAQQMAIVARFSLPLLQRAFNLQQPFKAVIDSPQSSAQYTVEAQR